MKVLLLWFKYLDGSNCGVVRVYSYTQKAQAELDLDMMKQHASDCKTWMLTEIEFYQ